MKKLSLVLFGALLILHCTGEKNAPELIEPTGGELVTVPFTLIWSSVESSTDYRVQVDTDIDFASPVIATDVNDTTYDVTNLDTLVYYWRVAAYDENDELGGFTDADSFRVTLSTYPNKYLMSITAGNSPFSIAITPDGSELWVNNTGQNDTFAYVISTATNQVTHTIPVTGFEVGEINIAHGGQYAYFIASYGAHGVLELSTSSYTQLRALSFFYSSQPVGPEGFGVAIDQGNNFLYASHYDDASTYGCIAKFNLTTGTLIDSVHIDWIYDVDLNHAGDRLYAVSEGNDEFYVIDPNNLAILNQMTIGDDPEVIVISADDSVAYVSHLNDDYVYIIDLIDNTVEGTFDAGFGPFFMALTPDGNYLYMCNYGGNSIAIADVRNQFNPVLVETLEPLQFGSFRDICFSSNGSYAYVVTSSPARVAVFGR